LQPTCQAARAGAGLLRRVAPSPAWVPAIRAWAARRRVDAQEFRNLLEHAHLLGHSEHIETNSLLRSQCIGRPATNPGAAGVKHGGCVGSSAGARVRVAPHPCNRAISGPDRARRRLHPCCRG
jgi:hypothetical protein